MYDDLVEIDCWMHLECVLIKRMNKRCVSTQDPFMDCENFWTMWNHKDDAYVFY